MGWAREPDPKSFPDPHLYATWMADRSPQFKTHSGPGHVKNAITGKTRNGKINGDTYVYRYDEDLAQWAQTFFLADGTPKADCALFKQVIPRAKREVKPVSQKALDATIQSIMNAAPKEHLPLVDGKYGANAEDCPACDLTKMPYPFTCPGPPKETP